MRRLGSTLALGALLAALALFAAPASAAPADRTEYAAQVNPICAAANAHAAKAFAAFAEKKGWKKLKRSERLFIGLGLRLNKIYTAALARIDQVYAAPTDAFLVSSWRANRRRLLAIEARLLRIDRELFRALAGPKPRISFKRFIRLDRAATRLSRRYERLFVFDVEWGAALGLSYCVSSATGLLSSRDAQASSSAVRRIRQ